MLPNPPDYFVFNQREGALAQEVWDFAEKQRTTRDLSFPHNLLRVLPQFLLIPSMRRLLYARDFITVERTYGTVNTYTKTKYTLSEIANVEHFYSAALLAVLGGMSLAMVGSAAWDGIISPGIKMIRSRGRSLLGVANDLKQLTVYDTQGAAFGCTCNPFILGDPSQVLLAAPFVAGAAATSLVK